MSSNPRLQEALTLLTQSPPGQTTQVYHDLRGILLDPSSNSSPSVTDSTLQSAAAVALDEYNTRELLTATVDGVQTIICQAAQVHDGSVPAGSGRYVAPKVGKTFVYDHVKRSVSDVKEAAKGHEEVEKTRKALEKALEEYVKDRYADGVSSVFAVSSVPVENVHGKIEEAQVEDAKTPDEATTAVISEEDSTEATNAAETTEAKEAEAEAGTEEKKDGEMKDDPVEAAASAEAVSSDEPVQKEPPTPTEPPKTTFTIHHVATKLNLPNFYSGRWRASNTLDPETLLLTSNLSVQVHYFENGNVQLNSAKPRTFQFPSSLKGKSEELAKEVVKVISAHEDGWQLGLEESYDQLAEGTFKALRRQLPLTRQKVDWDKVLNYRLGEELGRG